MPIWSGFNIPRAQLVKLRYAQRVSLSSATAVAKFYISMNSAYRPDIVTGGVQPEYFDFWSNLYQFYRVYNCSIEVKLANTSATNNI